MHVPDGWSEEKLRDLFEFKNGANTEAANYGSGIKFVNVMDILGNNFLTYEKIRESVNLPSKKADLYRLKIGDVLFNRTSETADEIALSSVYLDSKLAIFGGFVIRGRPVSNRLTPQFCIYCFSSSNVRKELIRRGQGAIRANIGQADMRNVPLLVPPLSEQQKIAQILSTWDKAIEKLEALIAAKQKCKKALMQQLLTGKVRFLGFENGGFSIRKGFAKSKLGKLPNDWLLEPIKKYYWYQEGPGVRKHQFTRNGVKLLNGTNIQNSKINLSNTLTYISEQEAYGVYAHFQAEDGDLVIACSGISVDRFDEKIAFLDKSHLPLCMNTSTMRFRKLDDQKASIEYFKYFMMSRLFKNQIQGQITGSAQLNFGPSHVGKCFVVLPSIEEQQKIATVLAAAENEITIHQNQLAALKQQKTGLMQQLLTGKKRVQVDQVVA